MIAKLKGRLDSVGDDWAVIDVGGVGYRVFCSGRTLSALPPAGEAVEVHTETHVREDHIHLFGFADQAERDWFNLLQSVQGIGARVALGVLSVLAPGELLQTIMSQDKTALTRAPSVGPKLATRVVNELKDKVGNLALGPGVVAGTEAPAAAVGLGDAAGDAVSALVNLGYRQPDALSAVQTTVRTLGAETDLQALIRGSLQELAR